MLNGGFPGVCVALVFPWGLCLDNFPFFFGIFLFIPMRSTVTRLSVTLSLGHSRKGISAVPVFKL